MAKSPWFSQLWLIPQVIKTFTQVPVRAISSVYQATSPSSVVLSFRHSQKWGWLDLAQCPTHQRSRRKGQHSVPHSIFTPALLCPCPLTWSLSYRAWSGLRPALPCQVDLRSSEAEKGERKKERVGRVCFPCLLLRCPRWDKTTSPKKRQTHFALEVMLKQCSSLPLTL